MVVVPPEIVKRALKRPVTRDLCVTHIGAFVAASTHYVERRKGAPQHVMIGCLAGKGHCRLGSREWSVGPGDVLFLPPGKEHEYRADPDQPWTIFWVHFQGLRAEDYLSSLGVSVSQPVGRVDVPTALIEAFEDTFRHTAHGFSEAAMLGMSTAFGRLLGLVRVHRREAGAKSKHSGERLLRTVAKMKERLDHPWTVDELSALAGLSVPHFTDLCRKQCGMPPFGLLIRLRLQRAMELLQAGSHNVGEAAREVGYTDPFYFSRLFKKHMGVAPSACRNGP